MKFIRKFPLNFSQPPLLHQFMGICCKFILGVGRIHQHATGFRERSKKGSGVVPSAPAPKTSEITSD